MSHKNNRGKCTQCGKGPRKLINGICQYECVKKNSANVAEHSKRNPVKQCRSCKLSDQGTGPLLNWVICSNPSCGGCYHAVCTKLGELSSSVLAAIYWICPKCVVSVKPVWVCKDSDATLPTCDTAEPSTSAISLDQIKSVMENLVKQVVPKIVEDVLSNNVNVGASADRSTNLESTDNSYFKVIQENNERQKRRCNVVVRNVEESHSSDAEERKKHDEKLFTEIADQVGLQDKPVKIMRLGRFDNSPRSQQYNRPMRVVFCREDPVVHLITAKKVVMHHKVYWFGRDLTKHERDLEFQARNRRRERQKQNQPGGTLPTGTPISP